TPARERVDSAGSRRPGGCDRRLRPESVRGVDSGASTAWRLSVAGSADVLAAVGGGDRRAERLRPESVRGVDSGSVDSLAAVGAQAKRQAKTPGAGQGSNRGTEEPNHDQAHC
ncbi:MAG: hypothetical protein GY835_18465, partial [bacterium]|nr:hypothetical protein [bacterium]